MHVIKVGVPVSNLANSGSRFFVCSILALSRSLAGSSARRLKRRTRAEFDIAVAIVARCCDQYVTLLPPNTLLMQLCINPASLIPSSFILTLYSRDALRSSGVRSRVASRASDHGDETFLSKLMNQRIALALVIMFPAGS